MCSKHPRLFQSLSLAILRFSKIHSRISHLLLEPFNSHQSRNTTSYLMQTEESFLPFDEMPHRNPISRNVLLSAHVRNGDPHKAWLLFISTHRAGLIPDAYTFTPVLGACSALLDAKRGRQAHALLIKTEIVLGRTIVNTALVDMYTKCGCLPDAVRVFRETRLRDVVMWNAMISGFVRHGRVIDAVAVFLEMRKDNDVKFSGFTLCSMLKACATLEATQQGKQIHAHSVIGGGCDSVLGTALVDFYSNCGIISDALRVFDGLGFRKDGATYNALISGCVQNNRYEEAFSILVRMQPNGIALTSVLTACSELLDLLKGKQIHCLAIRYGFESDTLLCNALLDMYAKCGMMTSANSVFDQIVKKDVVSWTSIIDAYGSHGCGVEALEMFKKMTRESSQVAPNSVTFLAVLSACAHSGLVEEARGCFVLMREKYGLDPGPEHYACFIDLLGRAGHIDEAWDLFNGMSNSTKQLAGVWAALLNACRANQDVVRGEFAAKQLLELEPENPGNYVLLSNFYAVVGRWEAIEECRGAMREKGLRKEAGSSWVAVQC